MLNMFRFNTDGGKEDTVTVVMTLSNVFGSGASLAKDQITGNKMGKRRATLSSHWLLPP